MLGLNPSQTAHALGIAASSACGLKENIGAMVKPLHAGMAARNGMMAARLAREGFTASERAIDGPQGYLAAMDSERPAAALVDALADLGARWEILDTGVTVKLYPSCAATHPPLDMLLDLKRRYGFAAEDVEAIDVEVDSMTPRLLIHERPSTGLEAKFSMPFCAAAALVFGHPGIATFDVERIRDPRVQRLMPHVTLRANPTFDAGLASVFVIGGWAFAGRRLTLRAAVDLAVTVAFARRGLPLFWRPGFDVGSFRCEKSPRRSARYRHARTSRVVDSCLCPGARLRSPYPARLIRPS